VSGDGATRRRRSSSTSAACAAATTCGWSNCGSGYDGGPWNYGVEILEFRGEKVARETIYVMDGWEAPEWRSEWWAEPPHPPND
jgi:hypothetical protein